MGGRGLGGVGWWYDDDDDDDEDEDEDEDDDDDDDDDDDGVVGKAVRLKKELKYSFFLI